MENTAKGSISAIWSRQSLQAKFLLISVPLIVLIASILFGYMHLTTKASERDRLERRIDQVADIEAVSLAGLVWSFNRPQIELFMTAIVNDSDIIGARVLDDNNIVLGENGVLEADNTLIFQRRKAILHKADDSGAGQVIGEFLLTYSIQRLQDAADQRFWNGLLLITLMTLSILLSAVIALHFAVRRPLNKFLKIIKTDQLEAHSAVSATSDVLLSDEVGTVVAAYNELQVQQRSYENELTTVRDGLELRVEERTLDLRQARDKAEDAFADLKGTQARLVQAEKMASLGQLTAGIAHEIKNPLNFVNNFAKLSAELLEELKEHLAGAINGLKKADREEAEELVTMLDSNLAKINEHGQRADSIVKNMLLHSRSGPSSSAEVDINKLVEEALALVFHAARAETPDLNLTLEKTFATDLPMCECFAQDISRVMINIMSNGAYAAHKQHGSLDSKSEPILAVATKLQGDAICIEVSDNGHGISKADKEAIFTPFFTTKPAGEGTGLGLSLSYDIIVTQHGGELFVDSKEGEYTKFSIVLPIKLAQDETSRIEHEHMNAPG